MAVELPECVKCMHYYVTYDPAKPYGCRAMGFKGKIMPSLMVFQASGQACLAFEEKRNVPSKPEPDKDP